MTQPAFALVVAAGTTIYPKADTVAGSTTASDSPVIDAKIVLESMTCLVIAGAGDIVISGHTSAAASRFTVTTTAACIPGTTFRFGANGIVFGKGLLITAGATTGTWLYSWRIG